ncbi:MAG: leucine--tRNA ligase [Bdellovibrio sp.]|nr:leucine--tRNA ligase [Bdellovibrio sp.]
MSLNFTEIEAKWQKKWEESKAFHAETNSTKPKYYALDMFPYPSGSGLHIGHMASYTPGDVISRYKRAKGFNVLHPMGYDAFGLPAEQYAIQTGVHPAITTQKAIESFRKTLKSFGFSFDWSREISTCEPSYYKWTQFIFLKLYEQGLAYQKEVPVNWCPALKTVLANDEVIDGKSERGGHPVIRVPMKQWMLKITDYAERLLQDLDTVDWPERTKEAQRNWIGKSEGARVTFKLDGHAESFEVFTTRPDTLFGVTFMVMAPEHELVKKVMTTAQSNAVQEYIEATSRKSEVDRKATTDKTGVFTGAYAIHPITNEKIPLWIADYVLTDYGTGAIMAVPGHDARDFEFATKFNLSVKRVLEGGDALPFEGEGTLVNSDFLNGLSKSDAIKKMLAHLEDKKLGTREVQYKLRDWLFSRQRYWGEPFPIVHYADGSRGVPVNELPVVLPEVADYEPADTGEAPLARNAEWVQYKNGAKEGRRETDTMPGAAGSSWYFLRYIDPHNDKAAFSPEAEKYWMPVDLYVGGPEHTVGHLLYSRFWMKVLFDVGLVTHSEPFQKLLHQGMILGPDGEKMSKSRGNVISPEDIAKTHGADAMRAFICFMGPVDKDKPWAPTGIDGVKRFLDRLTRLIVSDEGQYVATKTAAPDEVKKLVHKTIKKVTDDIESMSFNTAISAMMILVNDLYKAECRSEEALKPLVQILAPFAPHLAEELWEKMGGKGLCSLAPWPKYDSTLVADDTVTIGVQVNGKMRGTIELSPTASEPEALAVAKEVANVASALAGKNPDKVIYKAGKILNLIVK